MELANNLQKGLQGPYTSWLGSHLGAPLSSSVSHIHCFVCFQGKQETLWNTSWNEGNNTDLLLQYSSNNKHPFIYCKVISSSLCHVILIWVPYAWCSFSPGLQGDQTQSILKKSTLNIHWKYWCWSWCSDILATQCRGPARWKRFWGWERLRTGGRKRGQ